MTYFFAFHFQGVYMVEDVDYVVVGCRLAGYRNKMT